MIFSTLKNHQIWQTKSTNYNFFHQKIKQVIYLPINLKILFFMLHSNYRVMLQFQKNIFAQKWHFKHKNHRYHHKPNSTSTSF